MREFRRRCTTLLLFIAGVVGATTPVRAAEPKPDKGEAQKALPASSIQLLSADKVVVTLNWDDIANKNARLTLWNHSDRCQKIIATLYFPSKEPSDGTGAAIELVVSPTPQQMDAGEAASLSISLKEHEAKEHETKPQPGSYAGILKIQSVTLAEAPLELQLRVVVPGPRYGLDKMSVITWRNTPWTGSWSETVEIPLVAKYDLTSLNRSETIGFLHREPQGWATVQWIKVARTNASPTAVIQIDGFTHAGTYQGNISLPGVQDKTSQIPLTVMAKDRVIWPILTIVIGIALAWAAKKYVGVLRTVWGLREQEADLGVTLREAQLKFSEMAMGTSFASYSIAADVFIKRSTIVGHLDRLEETWSTSVEKDPDYMAVTEALRQLQAQLAQWPAFGSACVSLDKSIEEAAKHIDKAVMIPNGLFLGGPALLDSAMGQLDGKPIATEEIAPLLKSILDSAARVRTWDEANQHAVELSREYRNLATSGANDARQKYLLDVRNHLVVAWDRLWTVAKDDEVAAMTAIGGDLDLAGLALKQFAAGNQEVVVESMRNKSMAMFAPNRGSNRSIFRRLDTEAYSLHLPADDTSRSELLESNIRFGDTASLIFAFIIALITGLSASYWNKPFGTFQDYALLFLWAAGTKVGLDIVTAVTDRFVSVK